MFKLIGRQSSAAHYRVFKEYFDTNGEDREELLAHLSVLVRGIAHDAGAASEGFVLELRERFGDENLMEAFLINLEARIPKQAAKQINVNLLNQGANLKKTLGATPMFYANNLFAAYMQMVGQSPSVRNVANGQHAGGDAKSFKLLKEIRAYLIMLFKGREIELLTDVKLKEMELQARSAGLA